MFTSPHDDHIDKQEFLERCFPTAGRLRSQQILQLVKAGQDGVFVMYGYELESGERIVSALTQSVGSTQPNVSKHLKVLQDSGLVARRQQGNAVYYSIADAMVFELCEMICSRLHDRLEAQVGALKARTRD